VKHPLNERRISFNETFANCVEVGYFKNHSGILCTIHKGIHPKTKVSLDVLLLGQLVAFGRP
jgi:hypothetical protein